MNYIYTFLFLKVIFLKLELPFLRREFIVYILYPIGILFVAYIISLLINFNVTVFVMNLYFYDLNK